MTYTKKEKQIIEKLAHLVEQQNYTLSDGFVFDLNEVIKDAH